MQRASDLTSMDEIKRELVNALEGGQAYDTVGQLLSEVPPDKRYVLHEGMERSAWQILDHMRFTLEDLLAYSTNFDGTYQEHNWPDDYWPKTSGSDDDWDQSLAGYRQAVSAMQDLVRERDLTRGFAWEPAHNLLREAILAIEHAAYHSGELVELTRRLKE